MAGGNLSADVSNVTTTLSEVRMPLRGCTAQHTRTGYQRWLVPCGEAIRAILSVVRRSFRDSVCMSTANHHASVDHQLSSLLHSSPLHVSHLRSTG